MVNGHKWEWPLKQAYSGCIFYLLLCLTGGGGVDAKVKILLINVLIDSKEV